MFTKIPNIYTLTSSNEEGLTKLNAFDMCLLKSNIGNMNLIKVSSILPPQCTYIDNISFPLGSLVPVAYASITSNKPHQIISAAVAVAIPKNKYLNGLIMEYEDFTTKQKVENIVIDMVRWGMEQRGYEIEKIISISSQHIVQNTGCAFACVILGWDK